MQPILAKILVFCINFSLWAAGIALIVIGSIALADPDLIIDILSLIDGVENLTTILDVYGYLMGVAIFMVVLGSFLFLFGFVGCGAANPSGKKMSKRPMMSYSMLLIISVLTEIALIIYAAVIFGLQKEDITADLVESHRANFEAVSIHNDTGVITYSDKDVTRAWQQLQVQTACCGADVPEDYVKANMTFTVYYKIGGPYHSAIPPTCCSLIPGFKRGYLPDDIQDLQYGSCLKTPLSAASEYSSEGCDETAFDMLWKFYMIAIIISACIITAQLLGLVLTIRIWCALSSDSE